MRKMNDEQRALRPHYNGHRSWLRYEYEMRTRDDNDSEK